jgi:MFS family permease
MTEPNAVAPAIAVRDWFRRDVERPLEDVVGGPARLKLIALLAGVLALDAADKATIGAVAAQLEQTLHIGTVQIGLLVTVSTGLGAIMTLPFGVLVDRVNRTRLLAGAIVVWSLAMALGGISTSYLMLLLSRLLLGAVVAVASPATVSLTGDFFWPGERGRIFGYICAGELVGVAFGFLICGNIAAWSSWRTAFWVLAVLGFALAAVVWRFLPEPARGGQSHVPVGADEVPSAQSFDETVHDSTASDDDIESEMEETVAERAIDPHRSLVLERDPAGMPLLQAVRYILSIRTYRTLVLASALGYFYFTGLRTFAIVFVRDRFDLGQGAASTISVAIGLGAVVGVLLAGRIGDQLIAHGRLAGRVMVGAAAYLLAVAAFLPGLLGTSLWMAAPLLFVAAAGIGGANPAVDAARLDIMHSGLWGRAEGVRATLRFALEAIAPLAFAYVATWFGGGHVGFARVAAGADAGDTGLGQALTVMLAVLVAAGLILLLRAVHTYPRDVATAIASEHATRQRS